MESHVVPMKWDAKQNPNWAITPSQLRKEQRHKFRLVFPLSAGNGIYLYDNLTILFR